LSAQDSGERMEAGKVVKGLWSGAVAAVLFLGVSLQARSCQELCEKFGSYEACKRVSSGNSICGRSPIDLHKEYVRNLSSGKSDHFVLQTKWQGRCRFHVTVSPDHLRYEADPSCGDYYGIVFDGKSLGDDHVLDVAMDCQKQKAGRYQCHGDYGEFHDAVIVYQLFGDGKFDWKFYGARVKKVGKFPLEYRLFSDGKFLYEQFYDRGRLQKNISRRYMIHSIKQVQ